MKNKRKIIGLLTVILTVCALVLLAARHNRRVKARAEADRIITFQLQATEGQIRKAITSLLATKSWIRDMTKQDFQRVERLCDMRNEMRKEYKHYRRAWARITADRIISGQHQAIEAQITGIIVGLQLITHETLGMTEQDLQRVERLRDMCDEMRKSRGQPPRHAPFPHHLFLPGSSVLDPNRPAAPPDSNQGK